MKELLRKEITKNRKKFRLKEKKYENQIVDSDEHGGLDASLRGLEELEERIRRIASVRMSHIHMASETEEQRQERINLS